MVIIIYNLLINYIFIKCVYIVIFIYKYFFEVLSWIFICYFSGILCNIGEYRVYFYVVFFVKNRGRVILIFNLFYYLGIK